MNPNIHTYDDLLRHQQQMEAMLKAQKELVIEDLKELKGEFKPAISALGFIGKFTVRDKSNSLLTVATGNLVDLILRRVVLARAGWVTKLVVPFFLKNFSSNFIAQHKDEFVEKLFTWISPKNGNGKETPAATSHDGDQVN
jgi:hypothetical protein